MNNDNPAGLGAAAALLVLLVILAGALIFGPIGGDSKCESTYNGYVYEGLC